MFPILSSSELRRIEEAIKNNKEDIETSLDLNLTKVKLKLDKNGFYIDKNLIKIPNIREDDKSCYILKNKELQKLQFHSNETSITYKLIPTIQKPILKISATSMHKKEFVQRIERDRLTGKILDSGTGLGYTAIVASRTADQVITIELDKNVIEMAKLNPYSQDLFKKRNIKLINGDITKEIKKFKDEEFNSIIFDSGTPTSSGDFFSLNNYIEAYRVLKKRGKFYHYLPEHHITRGRDFGHEVIQRLKQAGFFKIKRNTRDSYVFAKK